MTAPETAAHAASWEVAGCRVTRLVEFDFRGTRFILPDATPQVALAVPWLRPEWVSPTGRLRMCVQMLVIDTPSGERIAVDTCVGNGKRRTVPDWHMRQGPFLERMRTAGLDPATFTHVVCTHLHDDHVGWNTRWDGARWVPTFPNARYIFVAKELEYWRGQMRAAETAKRVRAARRSGGDVAADIMADMELMQDSVEPLLRAGLVDTVAPDADVARGPRARVWLHPTPGHTPGHVCVMLRGGGADAVITGDCVHHPLQLARPDICARSVDADPAAALASRLQLLELAADSRALVFGTHWPHPTAGRVLREGKVFRLDAEPPTAFPGEGAREGRFRPSRL